MFYSNLITIKKNKKKKKKKKKTHRSPNTCTRTKGAFQWMEGRENNFHFYR